VQAHERVHLDARAQLRVRQAEPLSVSAPTASCDRLSRARMRHRPAAAEAAVNVRRVWRSGRAGGGPHVDVMPRPLCSRGTARSVRPRRIRRGMRAQRARHARATSAAQHHQMHWQGWPRGAPRGMAQGVPLRRKSSSTSSSAAALYKLSV
jgi:hypothetical protein